MRDDEVDSALSSPDRLDGLTSSVDKDTTSAASSCDRETAIKFSTGDSVGNAGVSEVARDEIGVRPVERGATSELTTSCPLAPEDDVCGLVADDTFSFYVGAWVTLIGLKTKVLNGASGTICSFDEASGRYAVKLSATGERKLIKETNLGMYHFDPRSLEPSCD